MPVYIYETIPTDSGEPPRQFEVKQSMNDDALTLDPETGLPVRRVISGGYFISHAPDRDSGSCCSNTGCTPQCRTS